MFRESAAIGGLLALACFSGQAGAQMAAGKDKFVGNVTGSSVPANFATYWNQVTPENSTKWGSVEGTRNTMNWSQADAAYNFAQTRGFKFKFHTFVWGSQYPGWITGSGLTQAQQRAAIEQWIQLPEEDRQPTVISAVRSLAARTAEQALELADEFGVGRDDGTRDHLAQTWAAEDPEAAGRWLADHGT